jgi:uncharacterized protein YecE (DUF72 family)
MPAGFGFSLKVPQVITHEKLPQKCEADVDAFLSAVRLLGDNLLCCCLQSGYFNKKAFASLDAFLERLEPFLAAWPDDVPVAVEIRNKNWLTAQFADCPRSHRAAWVLSDQAWMPSPLYIVQKLDAATGPFGYVRLLPSWRRRTHDRASLARHTDSRSQHFAAHVTARAP